MLSHLAKVRPAGSKPGVRTNQSTQDGGKGK